MKKQFIVFIAAFAALGQGCSRHGTPANPNALEFGAGFSDTAGFNPTMAVAKADSLTRPVTMKGRVANVCQAEGCWFNLSLDSNRLLFVDFNHKFTVPANLAGKAVLVQGSFYRDTISVERLKHLAADAGKSKAETDLITEPKVELNFRATGVKIAGK